MGHVLCLVEVTDRCSGRKVVAACRGKQYTVNTVSSGDGVLLTLTKDIVNQWREYFEDLLEPTDMPSGKKAGPGDPRKGSLISGAEVVEVVKKTPRWQGPGGGQDPPGVP